MKRNGEYDDSWDAGDLGCVKLLVALRERLLPLGRGGILEVVARNLGARSDVPAWCDLTGHTLLSADHPVYRIRNERRRP